MKWNVLTGSGFRAAIVYFFRLSMYQRPAFSLTWVVRLAVSLRPHVAVPSVAIARLYALPTPLFALCSTEYSEQQQFRPSENVDISINGDGYNVGWMMSGEYLRFTIDVTEDSK